MLDKMQRDVIEALGVKPFDGKVYVTDDDGNTEVRYMTLVDKDGNELYDEEESIIIENLIIACNYVANMPTVTKKLNEDGVNCLIRNHLKSLLTEQGYSIPDQSKRGLSAAKKDFGEVDIIIEKNKTDVALIEALNHGTKKYLHDHIVKAAVNYNQSGVKMVVILSYSRGMPYDKFWEDNQKWVSEAEGIKIWGSYHTEYSGIQCLERQYDNNGIKGKLYLIGANIQ